LAITGAARMLCMVVSNQTNSKTIPTTRSSDNTGRRSLRRRISQMPKMNKQPAECKFPSQGPGLEKARNRLLVSSARGEQGKQDKNTQDRKNNANQIKLAFKR